MQYRANTPIYKVAGRGELVPAGALSDEDVALFLWNGTIEPVAPPPVAEVAPIEPAPVKKAAPKKAPAAKAPVKKKGKRRARKPAAR